MPVSTSVNQTNHRDFYVMKIRPIHDRVIVKRLEEERKTASGGVALIKVGAATEVEMKEKKARVEDALHTTRAAVEEGVVPGGGVALLRARQTVAKLKGANNDQDAGIKIVMRALEEPLRQIVANTGDEPSVVLAKVLEGKGSGSYGWNAATGEYGDLVQMGVIDPTKVARHALQNAASVAALILTTDAPWSPSCRRTRSPHPCPRRRRHGLLIRPRTTRGPAMAGPFLIWCRCGRSNDRSLRPLEARRVSAAGRRHWSWAGPRSRAGAARESPCR
jgi:hypothetical protein